MSSLIPIDPLNSTLSAPWIFLNPTTELQGTIAESAKYFLDSLALSVNGSQSSRLRTSRKRKRSESRRNTTDRILQLKQLYVNGFTSDQIWEQALRILDSAGKEIEHDHAHDKSLPWNAHVPTFQVDNADSEIEGPQQSSAHDLTESQANESTASYDNIDAESGSKAENTYRGSGTEDEADEAFNEDAMSARSDSESTNNVYTEDRFGLNDGFFSIDDFNAQTDLLEREDIRGGPTDEVDTDSEEVDWHANPFVSGNAWSSSKKRREDDGGMSSDEDGPTFGNANLRSDSDVEGGDNSDDDYYGDGSGWADTSDIKYADFFAPPPRKVASKKSRPLPKTQPNTSDVGKDVDRAMADVRRDLFEDEVSDEDEEVSHDKNNGSKHQHSTHERQRARIADEIRRLEAANVTKKDWMLSGEARAADRPINSLIEEELDFERIGKPVPVVTTELSETIEDLVKRRILAKEFDEITRRHPGTSGAQDARRPRVELDDTKPQQSLAEVYETDHLRANDSAYVDPKNQKLAREHMEITALWKEISVQLDTLSNWHYKPRAPQANVKVITDAPAIMMEEARPTVGGAVDESAALAPHEIYAPGNDENTAGEVVLKTGASVAKDEMTRDEKAKMRRQQKKQKKTSAGLSNQKSGKAAEQQQIVSDLKKGGAKVIDKQGEITDIHGSRTGNVSVSNSGDMLKL